MKWFIASDIHGSAYYCRKMIESFNNEKADRLILLGDILYHGPRNDLPENYSPKDVMSMLNEMKDSIVCVRGNCDSEVDQMVLKFPIMADYMLLDMGKNTLFITHGHIYNENNLPPLKDGDILLHGHTHVQKCVKHKNYTYLNPGSVSLPKEDSQRGYITFENNVFLWKDFKGNIIMSFKNE